MKEKLKVKAKVKTALFGKMMKKEMPKMKSKGCK